MLGSYRPGKIKYEVMVILVCSVLARYISNMEIM